MPLNHTNPKKYEYDDISGDGYIPVYERTDLTDALHEISGFRTDFEIVSNRNMRKIFTLMKKEEK